MTAGLLQLLLKGRPGMGDISNLLISNVGATPYYMAIVTGRTHAHSSDLLVLIACNIARDCALVASL